MSRITYAVGLLLSVPFFVQAATENAPGASASQGPKIGLLKFNDLVNPQNPAQGPVHQWTETIANLQKELENKGQEVEKFKETIDKEAEALRKASPDGKLTEAQNQELYKKYSQLQEKAQKIQNDSQQAYFTASEAFKKDIDAASDTVLEKSGCLFIANSDLIVAAKNKVDVTPEVIKELNDRHAAKKRAAKAKGTAGPAKAK